GAGRERRRCPFCGEPGRQVRGRSLYSVEPVDARRAKSRSENGDRGNVGGSFRQSAALERLRLLASSLRREGRRRAGAEPVPIVRGLFRFVQRRAGLIAGSTT